jgi:CRISPR system Cascade subunit CasB
MFHRIYQAYSSLSKGDKADLKRCNLIKMADAAAYFRVLKYSGEQDNSQSLRILYLLVAIDITQTDEAQSVAQALLNAGVKETQIIQITRSGDNGIEYLRRQLVRCKNVKLESLGEIAQYWGDNVRRQLLKDFILADQH